LGLRPPTPKPQSPIPNPQSPIEYDKIKYKTIIKKIILSIFYKEIN
jgi:hypothetical protein